MSCWSCKRLQEPSEGWTRDEQSPGGRAGKVNVLVGKPCRGCSVLWEHLVCSFMISTVKSPLDAEDDVPPSYWSTRQRVFNEMLLFWNLQIFWGKFMNRGRNGSAEYLVCCRERWERWWSLLLATFVEITENRGSRSLVVPIRAGSFLT